jgi:hypothetical protein
VAPVDPQVLREERAGDQARAVVHPPLARELAHAGVHDRIAGAAVLPRLERLVVVRPPDGARAVVVPRPAGPGGRHLVEEVAPAELAHEPLGFGAAGTGLDLEGGEAAEP